MVQRRYDCWCSFSACRYEGITQKLKWNQRIREPPSEHFAGHLSDSMDDEFF